MSCRNNPTPPDSGNGASIPITSTMSCLMNSDPLGDSDVQHDMRQTRAGSQASDPANRHEKSG